MTKVGPIKSAEAKPAEANPAERLYLLERTGRLFGGAGLLLANLLHLVFIGAVAVGVLILYFAQDIPDHAVLSKYQPATRSVVLADNGTVSGEFALVNRRFVPITKIPAKLVAAFIAAEDQRFYNHEGVDMRAIARAVLTNVGLYGSGPRLSGGSTITQQMAKNLLLNRDRTYERKLKEIILSWRIEQSFTKAQILEIYLNEIFLGRTAYGVAAAAHAYFGKKLEELNISEIALLAGMPQAPSRYNPETRPILARARRDYVLDRMLAEGFITQNEADIARATKIVLVEQKPNMRPGTEYFVEEVRRTLLSKLGEKRLEHGGLVVHSSINPKLQLAANQVLRNGLIAYDRRHGWRGPVANLLKHSDWRSKWASHLKKIKVPAGHGIWKAAIVLELTPTEAVIGVAGGATGIIPVREMIWARKQGVIRRPGKPIVKTATGPYIRKPGDVVNLGDVILVEALKIPAAKRPLVSAKYRPKTDDRRRYTLRQIPIVSGALVAMETHTGRVIAMTGGFSFWISQHNGATQAKRQPGSAFKPFVYLTALEAGLTPATVISDSPLSIFLPGEGVYRPRNYSGKFSGPVTLRSALIHSRNVVAVRVAQHVGLDNVAKMAKRFGVLDNPRPFYSMALGAQETTPLKLVTGFAMIANGGKKIKASFIDRITDQNGKTVYLHTIPKCPNCAVFGKRPDTRTPTDGVVEPLASPASIFQLINILRGVVNRGTGVALSVLRKPIAGKTGTTNNAIDAWFVGFTTDLVVGVWIGIDRSQSLGWREQGGFTAAPVVRDFMKIALKGKKVAEFKAPKTVVRRSVFVTLNRGEEGEEDETRTVYDFFKRSPVVKRIMVLRGSDEEEEYADKDREEGEERGTIVLRAGKRNDRELARSRPGSGRQPSKIGRGRRGNGSESLRVKPTPRRQYEKMLEDY